MFKAIVITNNKIKFHHSTLNRQIISEWKDQVEFSPERSPQKIDEKTRNIDNKF